MTHDPITLTEFRRAVAGYRDCHHLPGMRDYYRRIILRTIDAMRASAWTASRREGRPSTHRPPSWAYTLREVA